MFVAENNEQDPFFKTNKLTKDKTDFMILHYPHSVLHSVWTARRPGYNCLVSRLRARMTQPLTFD